MLNTNATYATIKTSPHYLVISLKQKKLSCYNQTISTLLRHNPKERLKEKKNLQKVLET